MEQAELAIPILPSRSVPATVDFYRKLGFEGGPHAHDNGYAILKRGSVELHFFSHPALVPSESSAGCYIRVSDVRPIYRDCLAGGLPHAGIPRIVPLEDKPWGMREFAVIDLDGSLIRIGQVITP